MVATEKKKTSLARAVFSGSLGNMLEWFDYGLYGYFAAIISADFFVADDPIVGLLLSFLVFGTGFLVRPIGGILIGAYADKHGRIKALTLTILCMGVCTMLMGCLLRTPRWVFWRRSCSRCCACCRAWRGEANSALR